MTKDIRIVGILVEQRSLHAPGVQELLTHHGQSIMMRCGMPDPSGERGIITLAMQATDEEYRELEDQLEEIDGVSVKSLTLARPLENNGQS